MSRAAPSVRTRGRDGRRRTGVGVVAALSLFVAAGSVTQAAPRARPAVPRPRARPGTPKITIGALLKREREALQGLLRARKELLRVRVGKRVARGEMRRLSALVAEMHRRRQGVDRALLTRREKVRRRVRALYRIVRQTARRPLLDPRRASIPRDGRQALVQILRRDLAEIRHLRTEQIRLETALAEARQRRKQTIAVLRDLDRRRDGLQARMAQGHQELAALRHRRRNHQGLAGEWDGEAYRLERQIVALHLELQRQVTSFEQRRGKLVRPVPGMIVRWFGEKPVKGTRVTQVCHGVEISALPAWKVRAPADGTVRFVGHVPTFGNVVVLDHDEGYLSVVGYLGPIQVKVGQRVRQGRPIAALPPARGRRAMKVYFELRRSAHAIDPVPWLIGGLAERRKRGPKGHPPARRPARDAVAVQGD